MHDLGVPEPGDRIVVFGPNGAGKTTLLRQLAATGGHVSYLPQRPYLFRGSVGRNLGLGLDGAGKVRARRLAATLGVGDVLGRPAHRVSGGEAQRIAVARALASDAPLVLLDEPLAPLDVKDRADVAKVIAAEVGERAAVVVTHDLDTVAILADSVAVMIDGEVRQRGPVNEVLALPVDDAVAAAVGLGNALSGIVVAADGPLSSVDLGGGVVVWALGDVAVGERARVLFGAEAVTVHRGSSSESSARNRWPGRITTIRPTGRLVEILVDIGVEVAALLTPGSAEALDLVQGREVTLAVKATAIRAIARS
jgi:molybdopterin-binding protein